MSNRHVARSVVLQTLFELDSREGSNVSPDEKLVENAVEFAPDKQLFPFMKQLLDVVLAKKPQLDDIIIKAAPEWPLEKIAVVDRNILRLGLAELLFADREQVP
ncbi:MAG: transcription antitermination factor NusB, partial [bacterium]|nr:transcription antitermination factor NusB [bacterium]